MGVKTWNTTIHPDDQYSKPGDTAYFDNARWSYYWNEAHHTLRRYGPNGEYQEAVVKKRPELFPTQRASLSTILNTLFNQRKRFGTLILDQPGSPPPR